MLKDFKVVIKDKNFMYIWLSQILSQLTINIMNFVLLIKLFQRTSSNVATSMLWVSYSLPALLIGPFAATTIDLVDKRKMLIITNFLQALTIFLYALSHRTSFFLIYGVVVAYSFLNQFYVPAESATLPSVVKKKNLAHANSLFFVTQQASLILGFGVAGFLNKYLGFGHTLYLCSFLVFLAFVSVWFLPSLKSEITKTTGNIEHAIAQYFARFAEGYQFIKSYKTIKLPFLLILGVQVVISVLTVVVPVLAKDILEIDLNLAGLYIIVPAGIGAVVGAITVPKLIKNGWRKKRIIESSLISAVVLFFFLAFSFLGLSGILRALLGSLTIMLAGVSFVGIIIPSQTYIQEATPGGLRGRVFGNFWFFVTLVTVLPMIFAASYADLFGVKSLFGILGFTTLTVWLVSRRFGNKFLLEK
jgi:MFS family permease